MVFGLYLLLFSRNSSYYNILIITVIDAKRYNCVLVVLIRKEIKNIDINN